MPTEKKTSPKSISDPGLVHYQTSTEKSVMRLLLCIIEFRIAKSCKIFSVGKNASFLQLYIMYIRLKI